MRGLRHGVHSPVTARQKFGRLASLGFRVFARPSCLFLAQLVQQVDVVALSAGCGQALLVEVLAQALQLALAVAELVPEAVPLFDESGNGREDRARTREALTVFAALAAALAAVLVLRLCAVLALLRAVLCLCAALALLRAVLCLCAVLALLSAVLVFCTATIGAATIGAATIGALAAP